MQFVQVRVLADDLTGALECASAFSAQAPVPVRFGRPVASADAVQVVATDTRQVEPKSLTAVMEACLPWFTAGHIAFKKVDSLLRGNTFRELSWFARQSAFSAVVCAPAFPAQGRLTVDGQQVVVTPRGTAHYSEWTQPLPVVAALQAQGLDAYHVDYAHSPLPCPGRVMVLNATDDRALQYLANLQNHPDASKWLWCGSGALASKLAGNPVSAIADASHAKLSTHGPIVLATSSRHPVLRAQLATLQQSGYAAHKGSRHLELEDLMDARSMTLQEAQMQLSQGARQVVESFPRPAALVVVGGDTLLALCKASGATGVEALPVIRSGWGHARLLGGVWAGVPCFSRSGAFGDTNDLLDLLQFINPAMY